MKQIIRKKLENLLRNKDFIFPFSSGLSEREKAILSMSAGGETHGEIGEKFGVTRQRVGQLKRRAEEKVKDIERISETISELLVQELRGVVFTDDEVESAFLGYFTKTTEKDLPQIKMMWHNFSRNLWQKKNENN